MDIFTSKNSYERIVFIIIIFFAITHAEMLFFVIGRQQIGCQPDNINFQQAIIISDKIGDNVNIDNTLK